MKPSTPSFIGGFLVLFAVYHLPEFFSAFWLMALCKIGLLIIAYLIARLQGWKGLGGFGLPWQKGFWRNLLIGFITGIFFYGLSELLSGAFGFNRYKGTEEIAGILVQIPMLLLMTVFPSLDEDILTRGYLFGHLKDRMPAYTWILLSASVFVLNHIWRLGEHPAVLAYLFLLGLVLAFAVWKTGQLWLAFGIHWGSNLAFESNRAFFHTEPVATHYESTWILASCWLMLLVLMLFNTTRKVKKPTT